MIHVHELGGCAPAPLAHYLKALGLLRLVAEQDDPAARGWWEGERFRLATRLSRKALEQFLLERYAPTPLVAPWNKGSGFFQANDPGLTPFDTARAPRFARFSEGIKAARTLLDELCRADSEVRTIKAETKDRRLSKAERSAPKESTDYENRLAEADRRFKRMKTALIPRFRLLWRGPHREWMDAAMVLGDDGSPRFPALLGTGGNDGRLDFTNNYMQRLGEIFDLGSENGAPRPAAPGWMAGALWGGPVARCQTGRAVGQYLPGNAGGANSENGPEGDTLLNPWDFVLMLEGAIMFTAHATRRWGVNEASQAAAPFAVIGRGAGYASAADSDEGARGEQWMPLWSQPMRFAELKHLLAEGRAQIRARTAREPLDLARAVARLGTARGIVAFQRYGYLERNGQNKLAVPLGRFDIPTQISPRIACLDDLDAWLPRLRQEAHDARAPARLAQAERRLANVLFAVAKHPDEPIRWQVVLLALVEIEDIHRSGAPLRAGPIPRLRPAWVEAADDGSAAFRLALACALQARGFGHDLRPIDGVRRHWLPEKNGKTAAVMQGRDGISDAIALVERRLVEASQRGERRLPLVAAHRAAALPNELAAWIAGAVDPDCTLAMARALMALDASAWATRPTQLGASVVGKHTAMPDDGWILVRLALLPWTLPDRPTIGADPAIFRRLLSGDAARAVEMARRRLGAAGIQVTIRAAGVPPPIARRWAAALAFPISRGTALRLLHHLDPRSTSGDQP